MVEFFNPDGVAPPSAQYIHGAVVKADTDLLFIAGQVGVRPDGTAPDTIEEQADAAFANLITVLKSKGLGPQNIVKMQVFVTERAHREAAAAARRKHLGEAKPTSTFLIIQGLAQPNLMIEVEAIAAFG